MIPLSLEYRPFNLVSTVSRCLEQGIVIISYCLVILMCVAGIGVPVYGQDIDDPLQDKSKSAHLREEPVEQISKDVSLASLFDSTSYVVLPKGVFVRKKESDVPAHSVVISKSIQIGTHEVTQMQWESIMGYNPSDVVNPYNPVESISWFEVQSFIDSLNVLKDDVYTYRLPTEAEWEYACLAGSVAAGPIDEVAWFNENSDERPHPIKQLSPNSWGLYDMRGNVWEWVQDWYALYEPKENVDPGSPGSGRARIIRGGSWWSPAEITTCSHRGNLAPDYKAIILGFRLVREIEGPSAGLGS